MSTLLHGRQSVSTRPLPGRRPAPDRLHRFAGGLSRWLFPAPPKTTVPIAVSSLCYLGGAAVVAGAALLRQAGEPAWETMWAEDGKVFYSQALSLPFASTLVTPHAGYIELYPRLVAGVATLLPPRDASWVMALAGAFSLGVLTCLVFHMASGHVPSRLLRGLLAASMVLLPVAGGELLDNAVNVPWWLFFACFWALLWRPHSRAGPAAAFLVCALAAASEPLSVLFVPLAGLRVVALGATGASSDGPRPPSSGFSAGAPLVGSSSSHAGRRPKGRLPRVALSCAQVGRFAGPVGLAAGLGFQLLAILANGSGPGARVAFALPRAGVLAEAIGTRVGLDLLAGVRGTDWLVGHNPGLATAAGFAVILLVGGVGVLCPVARARAFALLAVVGALACFLLEAWARGMAPALATHDVGVAARYQALPLLLLLSSLIVSAGAWAELWGRPLAHAGASHLRTHGACAATELPASARPGRRGPFAGPAKLQAAAVCTALLAPAWAIDFRDPNARSSGPAWPSVVVRAGANCAASHARNVEVPIEPAGWSAELPCAALRGDLESLEAVG